MTPALQRSRALSRAARPALTALAVLIVAVSAGGCWQSPRFQAPFTLSNPNERHPISVKQGEALLDLSVSPNSRGLSSAQWGQLYAYLENYKDQKAERLLIKAPTGGANENAAMRAYDDVRHAMSRVGISPRDVTLEPYLAKWDSRAPLRLSYLQYIAEGPDCPDWSENVGRDPQNMPSPNMGCATQRNLAAMVANPEDLLYPRAETPRPGERRDVVWHKYVNGDVTGSKWGADERPLSEHANASDLSGQSGGGQ